LLARASYRVKPVLRKELLMYAAIRKYSIKPGWMEEVMQRIQRDLVFIISQEPGFLDYYALRVGPTQVLTVSVFDTRAGTEGSISLAFEWVQQNLARFVQGVPEATDGQVFAGAYAPASRDDL
jgi:heme-degrading monooxygenase HmoA